MKEEIAFTVSSFSKIKRFIFLNGQFVNEITPNLHLNGPDQSEASVRRLLLLMPGLW